MATKEQSAALAEHWRHHIDAWKASGQSQSSFCKANALNYHRFCYWQRKFHQQPQQAARGGFSAVSLSPEPANSGLSITLPGGLVVQGITAGNLALVCQLLNDLS
jgi:hypothetical protein